MLNRFFPFCLAATFAVGLLIAAGGRTVSAQEPASYAGRTAEQWTRALADHIEKDTPEDKEETRRAAQALGLIGPPAKAAVPLLAQALQSSALEVRQFAVDALGRIGPDAAGSIPAILKEVDIPKDHQYYKPLIHFRRLAANAFGKMGPAAVDAVPVLEAALRNEDMLYRVEAALALWRIQRDARSVPELQALIRLDQDAGVFESVMALGHVGADALPAKSTLIAALGHNQSDVRRAAAQVLAGFGPEMLPSLTLELANPETPHPRPIAFAVGQLFGQIREDVLYGDEIAEETQESVNLAGTAFARMMASDDASGRQTASRGLAQMGVMGVSYLIEPLQSDVPDVREIAARTLVRIEANLPSGPSANVDECKQMILPMLMKVMEHPDPQVQAAAFRAFAELQFGDAGSQAIPLLRNALRNPDVAIRRHAAKALKQYEDE